MITQAKERMRKSRAHRRLGLRPVQVLVSPSMSVDLMLPAAKKITLAPRRLRSATR